MSTVTVDDHPEAGRYELSSDGERIGFLRYRIAGEEIALLHAEVDPAQEGQGWGSRLVAGTLDDVRGRGLRVRPVCPFVVAFIRRHPEYQDLLA